MEKELRNDRMAVERWKQACKAGSNQSNYRRERGLTETILASVEMTIKELKGE